MKGRVRLNKIKKAAIRIAKGTAIFFATLILMILLADMIFPVSEDNYLLVPVWYSVAIMVVPIVCAVSLTRLKTAPKEKAQKETVPIPQAFTSLLPAVTQAEQPAHPNQAQSEQEEVSGAHRDENAWIATEKKLLKSYWAKSREYRVMLKELSKELEEKELSLIKKEDYLNIRDKEAARLVMESVRNERDALAKEIEQLKASLAALRKTETDVVEWIRRMESRDQSVFAELLEGSRKAQLLRFEMDGFEFEQHVADLLRAAGYTNVIVTQKSGDYGADVTAKKDGVKYVIQCKYYQSLVGIEAVQQIHAAKEYYNAHVAVVATNSAFTRAAKTLAAQLNVLLWDGEIVSAMDPKQKADDSQAVHASS